MKNKIIMVVCLLLLMSCQKSNSSPVGSEKLNNGEASPIPPVTTTPISPDKDEWRKKLEACPVQLTQEMSLEQVAETSRLMHQKCGFTENEWAQVIRNSI